MNYIIDSVRCNDLKEPLEDTVIVTRAGQAQAALNSDDYVFAHLTDLVDNLLGPRVPCDGQSDVTQRVIAFLQKLKDSITNGTPPTLIIYSGGQLNNADVQEIKTQMTGDVLSGFPHERIDVKKKAFSRTNPQSLLNLVADVRNLYGVPDAPSATITAIPTTISPAENPVADVAPSPCCDLSTTLDMTDYAQEAVLSMRVLCEAWLMNDGHASKFHGNIKVNAPTSANDWFAPFAKSPSCEDAQGIAKPMGSTETQTKVDAFLRDLVHSAGPDGILLYEEKVRELITKLLKTLKAPG